MHLKKTNEQRWARPAGTVAAVAIAGTLMLGIAGIGNPSPAFAVNYGTGSVTITQAHNSGATYDGYRIFKAVVDADDKASEIEWESDTVKGVVVPLLNDANNGAGQTYSAWLVEQGLCQSSDVSGNTSAYTTQRDLAQNAAEYISKKIGKVESGSVSAGGSATDAIANTNPRTTKGNTFASTFARAIVASNLTPATGSTPIASGTAYTGTQGYYLFVTHSDTITNNEAGTAPVWVAVGTTAKSITEKSAVPTLTKEVEEDSTKDWGSVADSNITQNLNYRLTATVAQNTNAFPTYRMQFTDTMTHITMDSNDVANVKIKVNGTDVTTQVKEQTGYVISCNNNVLTVNIPNILGLGQTITDTSTVVVEYPAHLTTDAIIGGQGNPSTAILTYSSDPARPADVDNTNEVTTKVFAYKLQLTKVDQATRELLDGAKFTIQVASTTGSQDTTSVGKYVQADGSLGTTAVEFTTSDGIINAIGIDEGTYVIHETTPPADHKVLLSDVTLTLTRTWNGSNLSTLTASVSGGNGTFSSATAAPTATSDGVQASTSTGQVDLTVSNKQETYLPGTGLTTSQAGVIFGAVCVAAGLVGIVRHRKGNQEDEQE